MSYTRAVLYNAPSLGELRDLCPASRPDDPELLRTPSYLSIRHRASHLGLLIVQAHPKRETSGTDVTASGCRWGYSSTIRGPRRL